MSHSHCRCRGRYLRGTQKTPKREVQRQYETGLRPLPLGSATCPLAEACLWEAPQERRLREAHGGGEAGHTHAISSPVSTPAFSS